MNLLGLARPPQLGFNYRHFDFRAQQSNCADIFTSPGLFAGYPIIMMLRDPLERAESEYHFMRSRAAFSSSYPGGFPQSFEAFARAGCTSNSVLKFLLGRKLYSADPITEEDYEKVLVALRSLQMIYGLTHAFSESLNAIEQGTGIRIEEDLIKQYRVSVYKQPRDEASWPRITRAFNANNRLDNRLFEWVKGRFEQQKLSLIPVSRDFDYVSSRYHSLLLYSGSPENRCPLNLFIPGLPFVQKHKLVLRLINKSAKQVAAGDGRLFAAEWVRRFSEHFKMEPPEDADALEALEHFSRVVRS